MKHKITDLGSVGPDIFYMEGRQPIAMVLFNSLDPEIVTVTGMIRILELFAEMENPVAILNVTDSNLDKLSINIKLLYKNKLEQTMGITFSNDTSGLALN